MPGLCSECNRCEHIGAAGHAILSDPAGVAVDSSNNIYVVDAGAATGIWMLSLFSSDGSFIAQWSGSATSAGSFEYPYGVAVDAGTGEMYVADNAIVKFNEKGTFITLWNGSANGHSFNNPKAVRVAVDAAPHYVYVADTGNNCIQKFTSSGDFITEWGNTEYGFQSDSWHSRGRGLQRLRGRLRS